MKEVKVYFKQDGKLTSRMVNGFSDDIKSTMEDCGLDWMRASVRADKESPIMAIAK